MPDLHISDITLVTAPRRDQDRGLLYYVSFTIAGCLRVCGVALRRTVDGRHVLSFPERRDGSGRRRPIVHPVNTVARQLVTHVVLEALSLDASGAIPDPNTGPGPARPAGTSSPSSGSDA